MTVDFVVVGLSLMFVNFKCSLVCSLILTMIRALEVEGFVNTKPLMAYRNNDYRHDEGENISVNLCSPLRPESRKRPMSSPRSNVDRWNGT